MACDLRRTPSLSMTDGDVFFFRVSGKGQEMLCCGSGSFGQSFDDRRQTLAAWANSCTGTGTNTVDLGDAMVVGIQVDWGTFTPAGAMSVFADGIHFDIGNNVGNYNFEVTDATVPEPASIALVGGLFAFVRWMNEKGPASRGLHLRSIIDQLPPVPVASNSPLLPSTQPVLLSRNCTESTWLLMAMGCVCQVLPPSTVAIRTPP